MVLGGLFVWFGPWLPAAEPRMGGDVTLEFYPRLAYAVGELRQGALPLWSGWTMAGTPLLANPQLGVLYPGHWPLLLALPIGMVLNYAVMLHLGFAAVATYALGLRLRLSSGGAALAAMSYALNGMFAARLWAGNVSLLEVMAWVPAMLYAADCYRAAPTRRTWLFLTGTLTLSLLVGFYHPWYLALLAVALYLAWMPGGLRSRLQRLMGLALAVLAAAGMAAPELLPALELIGWTTRTGRLDWEFATAASLAPWQVVSLVLPEVFGSGAGTYWPGPWWHWQELTAYAGLLPLVLAGIACSAPGEAWSRYCAALAVLALVLALGHFTPVYAWFYAWFPGYGSFRDPGRHLLLFSLAVALLAGRGADRLVDGYGRRAVLGALVSVFLVGSLGTVVALQLAEREASRVVPMLSALGVWAPQAEVTQLPTAEIGGTVLMLVVRACGVGVVAAAAALVAVVLARRMAQRWRPLLLLGALFLDLSTFAWRYVHEPLAMAPGVPFGSPTQQFSEFLGADNLSSLQESDGVWRTAPLGRAASIVGNAGYLLGVPLAIGLDPLLPRRYAELVGLLNGQPVTEFENLVVYLEDRGSRLWPLLSARYRLDPQEHDFSDAPPRYTLDQDPTALPRAFAVEKLNLVDGPEASLRTLAADGFDPAREAVIEVTETQHAEPQGEPSPDRPTTAGLRELTDRTRQVTADLPVGGAIVLLDAWHPGWRATLDGQDLPVYPVDHAFLGVVLPPGSYEIRFQFDPASWRLGLTVSAATLLLLVGVSGLALHKARRRARPIAGC